MINAKIHIIKYKEKDFICENHNESYLKYCLKCKTNICLSCIINHRKHEIISYEDIIPDLDAFEDGMEKLRNEIDKLKCNILHLIKKLNKVINNLELYYNKNEEMINNYKNKNINYELIQSLNQMNNDNNSIIKDLEDVNNDKDYANLLCNILNVNKKMNNIEMNNIKIDEFNNKVGSDNFFEFIKKMKKTKIIVYTINDIDEPLQLNDSININTKLFGKINKNNIKEIKYKSFISENELKKELEKYNLEEDKKIIIFKFHPEINDMKNLINFLNEYNNENSKKGYIFIIRINRLFEQGKYIEKDKLIDIIYNYNDFYQKFFYKLNEKELSEKIINLENIDIQKLFMNIFENKIKNINDDNTILKFIDFIINGKKLISYLYPFITIIFRELIDNNKNNIIDEFELIKNNNKLYLGLVNNSNNDVLNQIILNIFDNHFNLYFESIQYLPQEELEKNFPKYFEYKKIKNKINPIYILLDKNLELFEKYINILEEIYNNRIGNKKDKNKNELYQNIFI